MIRPLGYGDKETDHTNATIQYEIEEMREHKLDLRFFLSIMFMQIVLYTEKIMHRKHYADKNAPEPRTDIPK
jgi:hypothetical protein